MRIFIIISILTLTLLSCTKDSVGGGVSPYVYYIDIEGYSEQNVTITYPAIPEKRGSNIMRTESVSLPYTKRVEMWGYDKKISHPSITLTNTTGDSISVLLTHLSGKEYQIDGKNKQTCLISNIIDYQRLNSEWIAGEGFDKITMDSLFVILKEQSYKWMKIVKPEEHCKLELPKYY